MKINIQTKNFSLSSSVRRFIVEKIKPLEKFINVADGKYQSPSGKTKTPVKAWVEVGKRTHHKKGPVFRAECQIELPGNSVRAESASQDLRTAIVEIKDELQRELKKLKERMAEKRQKAQRTLKKTVNISSKAKFSKEIPEKET